MNTFDGLFFPDLHSFCTLFGNGMCPYSANLQNLFMYIDAGSNWLSSDLYFSHIHRRIYSIVECTVKFILSLCLLHKVPRNFGMKLVQYSMPNVRAQVSHG